MNKKQMDSKKANKNLSKKVAPLVMSTSMMAAAFLAAGAPTSAAELDTKGVNPEVIEQAKNHGQEVSALAKSLPGSPEKGKLVSKLAQENSGKTNDDPDDNIDETNNDGQQEGEISDDASAAEEDVAEETEAPAAEDGQVSDDASASEEGTEEEPEAPAAEDGQEDDGTLASEEGTEEGTEEEPEAPTAEDGQVGDDASASEEEGTEEEPKAPAAEDGQEDDGTEAVEGTEAPTTEDGQVDGSQNKEDDSWVDETYQFIADGYQSVIGYYQTLIEQKLAQKSEESEKVEAIDVESDISADAGETDTTTLEADTSQDISVDNANTGLTNDTDVNLESPVVVENQDQPSDVETPEKETVESVENTVSNLEEPVQTVKEEVSLATETEQASQNEVEKESDQISLKDKLIGYYQDLAASFSNFMNFLK